MPIASTTQKTINSVTESIQPQTNDQWYFFVLGVIVLIALWMFLKFRMTTKTKKENKDDDSGRTKGDNSSHEPITSEIDRRFERIEDEITGLRDRIESVRNEYGKEIGEYKTETYDKLLDIAKMVSELKGELKGHIGKD